MVRGRRQPHCARVRRQPSRACSRRGAAASACAYSRAGRRLRIRLGPERGRASRPRPGGDRRGVGDRSRRERRHPVGGRRSRRGPPCVGRAEQLDDGSPRRARARGRTRRARARCAREQRRGHGLRRQCGPNRARQLGRVSRFVRAEPVLRIRVRLRRRGRRPDDRDGGRRCAWPGVARSGGDRRRGGRPRGRAARRAPAGEPALPGRARPVRGGELRVGDRPDALRGRCPAGTLALRGQGGRAGRRPPVPARGRRARAGGARDRSVRRRGHPPAAHASDRGGHASRASSSTRTRAAAASTRRRATAPAAPTVRRPRSARPT